jgi:hypothetical protein
MYAPTPVPTDQKDIPGYLAVELQALANALQARQQFLYIDTLNVAPTKPRDGMIVRADGVNWNPGAGTGFYGYRNGGWNLLG